MTVYPHSFEGQVVPHDVGTYCYTVVFLPEDVASALPFDRYPRLRITGEIGDVPFSGAWQPVRGRWYLMLGKRLLKEAGLGIGDWAEVRFAVDDQDAVEVPDELERALAADRLARQEWESLSAGKKRALAHRVLGAKSVETRRRRLAEVMEHLRGECDLRIGGARRRDRPAD